MPLKDYADSGIRVRSGLKYFAVAQSIFFTIGAHSQPTFADDHKRSSTGGNFQVQRMLEDRPRMREYVDPKNPIWTWSAEQFDGGMTGREYLWNSKVPPDRRWAFACHAYDWSKEIGWVYVSETCADGSKPDGEYQWAMVIFELLSTRNETEFQNAWERALLGWIDKHKYVEAVSKLEYRALKDLSLFYKQTWKPNQANHDRKMHDKYWFADLPNTYEEWIARYPKGSGYLSHYAYDYDEKVLPFLRERKSTGSNDGNFGLPVGDFEHSNGDSFLKHPN